MRTVSALLLTAIVGITICTVLIYSVKPQTVQLWDMQDNMDNHLHFRVELYYDPYTLNTSSASLKFTIWPEAYYQGETPNAHIDFVKFSVLGISTPTTSTNEYQFTLASNVDLYFGHNITQQISGFVPLSLDQRSPHAIPVTTFAQYHLLPSSPTVNAVMYFRLSFSAYDSYIWNQDANKPLPLPQETTLLNGLTIIFIGATAVLSVVVVALWRQRLKSVKNL